MAVYADHVSAKKTPQTEPVPGKAMVPNSAGGFGFEVSDWTRLDRFLVLGAEGGTYYAGEKKLTVENAAAVQRCLKEDGPRAVSVIAAVSDAGRAPKNDPAIFALALAVSVGDDARKRAAFAALPAVCRTGTHLFAFVESADKLRGWGRGLRRSVLNWYAAKDEKDLAYQLMKYQQRNGWSHRDVLRLAGGGSKLNTPLLRWAVGAGMGDRTVKRMEIKNGKPAAVRDDHYPAVTGSLPANVLAFEELKKEADAKKAAELIRTHRLVRECVPTQHLTSPDVWSALLDDMPVTAMLRNLATMTKVGLIAPLSEAAKTVCDRLSDADRLKKGRVHPLAVLVALNTYKGGRSVKGDSTWNPVPRVVDALDGAFYSAFDAVEPTGKRWLLALDVSGSMGWGAVAGTTGVTPRVGSATMAMVTARTERDWHAVGFSTAITPIPLSPRQRLDDVVATVSAVPMGGTDCAQPMLYAAANRIPVDVFAVYTDNETWAGRVHPFQALKAYRDQMGIAAKLVVVGMTATEFTIADPADAGMLDVVGFSTDAPAVMADFARG